MAVVKRSPRRNSTAVRGEYEFDYSKSKPNRFASNAKREPTSPGEILREEFLAPMQMTQRALAEHIGTDVKVVNRIVNGRTSVTAEMALKLGAAFGTSPDFWLNAQKAVDLYRAAAKLRHLPRRLRNAS